MSKQVWVLNWREELEDQGNQTETVYPAVFALKRDAIAYAVKTLKRLMKSFGAEATDDEIKLLKLELESKDAAVGGIVSHLAQPTDSDNIVFELSRRTIHGL